MFSLLRCLTAVSSRCKAMTGARFVDGVVNSENWVEAGDAALTGAPNLMTDVKDALNESVSEHRITRDQGELVGH